MIAKLSGKFEGRARIPPMHSLELTVLLPILSTSTSELTLSWNSGDLVNKISLWS